MYKIGYSLGNINQTEEMFVKCRHAGIRNVEISCHNLEEVQNVDFAKMRQYGEENEVNLWSFHLPFGPFSEIDISSANENVRRNCVKILCEYIKRAADIGIDKYIIHPSAEPIEEKDRPYRLEKAKESLASLAETASGCGGVMAVEDLPRSCLGRDSSEMLELLSADSRLRSCFDTNHLLKENPADYIGKVGDKIITTHVSDYDFVNERHWLPGEGKMDWPAVLAALQKINYSGVWLYEIGLKCPKTIIRDRDLTCEDFVRNANEIFSGKKPTVFSRPKPNLGMWE